MGGYRPGYSERHSPWYREGVRDGEKDAARARLDPPKPPCNFDQHKAHSVMYQRGYNRGIGAG